MANISNFFQDYWLPSNKKSPDANYDSGWARDDIQYLYQKLSKFSRTTTQWDLYKISEIINDKESYLSQINSLVPYSSAIIGTRFTDDKGISYNVGDLIYKNLDQSTTHIVAERGGVFQPGEIEYVDQTLKLTFQYLSKEPEAEAQNLERIATIQPANSSIYGHVFEDLTINPSFPTKIDSSTQIIPPIIKMYDKNNEEVYCDHVLVWSSDNTECTIGNIPTIITKVVVK